MKIIRLNVARQASKEDFQGNTEEYWVDDYSRAEIHTDKNILRGVLYTQVCTTDIDGNIVRVSDKFICRQQLPKPKAGRACRIFWWSEDKKVQLKKYTSVLEYAESKNKSFQQAINSLLWEGNSYTHNFIILCNRYTQSTYKTVVQGILNGKQFCIIDIATEKKMFCNSFDSVGFAEFKARADEALARYIRQQKELEQKFQEECIQDLGYSLDIAKEDDKTLLYDNLSYWYEIDVPADETALEKAVRFRTVEAYLKHSIKFSRVANESNIKEHLLPKVLKGNKGYICVSRFYTFGPIEVLIGKSEILDSSL